MTTTASAADFDAAQARLQAWRSRRPGAADWASLEAILGFEEFLARARQPPFAHWLAGMRAEPTLQEIDYCLRAALRRDCAAMASWYGAPWNVPLRQLAAIVDLPLLAHMRRGESVPPRMLDDPRWRALADAPPEARFRVATGLDAGAAADADLLEAWMSAWLATLPRSDAVALEGFTQLARAARAHRVLGATAQRDVLASVSVAERLAQLFRRHAATPVAMACELAAVALDLRRLRYGLVRRALAQRAVSVAA